MNNEIGKDIPGYEGLYQVSNVGRVKSLTKDIIMKPQNCKGYLFTTLTRNKKHKQYYIHRLVAMTFIPNPENKETVNHINEQKTDNRVENLNGMTAYENNRYGTHDQRMAISQGRPIRQFTRDDIFVREYWSATEAARVTGIIRSGICNCLLGVSKSAGGFKGKYAD